MKSTFHFQYGSLTLVDILHTAEAPLDSLGTELASVDSKPYNLYKVHRFQPPCSSTYFYHIHDLLHTAGRMKFF